MTDEKLWILLGKYLNNECSPEETDEISMWLNSDGEHQLLFKKIKKTWAASGKDVLNFIPDIKTAWENINSRIESLENTPKKNTKNNLYYLFPRIWKIAAVFIVCLSTYLLYNQFSIKENKINILAAESTNSINIVNLPDGSRIWLNIGSKLEYPESFSSENRKVVLSGEAFFEISKDSLKPFIITAQRTEVKVLGTSFIYRSIHGENKDLVIVKSGKVLLSQKENSVNTAILEKNLIGEFDYSNNKIITKINESENCFAWKTGRLVYEEERLENIISGLSKYYRRKINLENVNLKNTRVTITFDNLKIEESLKLIEILLHAKVTHNEDSISIY